MVMVAAQVQGATVKVMVVAAQARPEEACLPEFWNHFQFLLATYKFDYGYGYTSSLRRLHRVSCMAALNMLSQNDLLRCGYALCNGSIISSMRCSMRSSVYHNLLHWR
jgi:hypothetical protein